MFTANGYYPKLQACVPFTPVTGPRLMARGAPELQKRAISCLVSAIRILCNKSGISSAHVTFPTKSEWEVMGREGTQFSCITVTKVQILTAVIAGFLQRTGIQYHWHNAGYATFQEFLETLKQSKRKSIRQERSKIRRVGLILGMLYLLHWYKNTNSDADLNQARGAYGKPAARFPNTRYPLECLLSVLLEHSRRQMGPGKPEVHLLYWYKSTNSDANEPARRT
jgi:hypothetical protein